MMQEVDKLLQLANYPTTSHELCRLLQRMVQLERRLLRLSPECRDVFDAPVKAIVERCLGALDYRYLTMHLDIFSLIENIHGDYHRTKILRQYHIEGVVNVLLSKARKLTVEEIVNYSGDFRNYVPPTNTLPTAPVPHLVIKPDEEKTQQPKTSATEFTLELSGASVIDKYSHPHHATSSFIDFMNSADVLDYTRAFVMNFGFDPTIEGEVSDFFDSDFISSNLVPRREFVFPNMKEVCREITKEVKARKSNDGRLGIYIYSLCNQLSDIARLLFPQEEDDSQQKLKLLLDFAERFNDFSLKRFTEAWEDASSMAEREAVNNPEKYISILFCRMVAKEITTDRGKPEHALTGIMELRTLYRQYESAIEAALLLNKVKNSIFDYQTESGICFLRSLYPNHIAELTGLTVTAVKGLAKSLGHPLTFTPKVTTKEEIKEPDECISREEQLTGKELPEPVASQLPENLQPVSAYFEAMREAGYINDDYKWIRTRNHTNYHAVWASKIICARNEDYTHDMIGDVFGIKHLGSYITDADSKPSIKSSIEKIFREKGLSTTTQ